MSASVRVLFVLCYSGLANMSATTLLQGLCSGHGVRVRDREQLLQCVILSCQCVSRCPIVSLLLPVRCQFHSLIVYCYYAVRTFRW